MLVDVSLLLSNVVNEIIIDDYPTFDSEDIKSVGLLRLENVHVTGKVRKNSIDTLSLDLNISGEMYLPCSITLKEVKHEFDIKITDEKCEENENILRKGENILELKSFLWENIVVEIPLRVVSSDAYNQEYKGSGWQLITDEDYVKENKALSSLSDMFKSKEEE